jgi:broad specificity phosphatase PhoE
MTGRLVLVRHGQSISNVDRKLDTRPPGRALTELGHEQARTFAREWTHPIGMVAHSVALRATETAAGIAGELGLGTMTLEGIHEVQVGDIEDRSDDEAHEQFTAVYQRWQEGDLDALLPGGESGTDVLDRYLPVVTQLRMRYLDDHDWKGDVVVVSHGAAIRLVGAVLGGIDASFALENHLANTQSVVLSPITDGRWSCVQWAEHLPPFEPEREVHALNHADPMG